MDFRSTRWALGQSDSGELVRSSTHWTPLAMGVWGGDILLNKVDEVH